MTEIVLPTGAKLVITSAPFADAKALYQAVVEEMRGIKASPDVELDTNWIKDMLCAGLSSKKIDAALAKCMERATYDGIRIVADTFEPVKAREDYLTVCFEVAKENIMPFTKSLYAKFAPQLEKLKSSLA